MTGTAAVALVFSAGAASNNGDLILGFTSGIGNDLMVDIGQASSLTNGKAWNLATPLAGFDLTTVNWGVIGCLKVGTLGYSWTSASIPVQINGLTGWGNYNIAIKSVFQNFSPSSGNPTPGTQLSWPATDQNSWYAQTVNPSLPSQYFNVIGASASSPVDATGLTSASFYLCMSTNSAPTVLGTFSLGANGVVTFNAASASAPPAPHIVRITRAGGTSTVFFTTTNGTFTYTLYYTNTLSNAGSVSNWPASPTTLVGDGNTNSLTDTTADALRFYRVGVH